MGGGALSGGDAEVVVAGGGPAGAACALVLARAGWRVVLVERAAGARETVCGEFLGVDALGCLAVLGVDAGALGGVAIGRAVVARGGGGAGFDLPFPAVSLPRGVLDEALLLQAVAAGVALRRGVAVRAAEREGDGWGVRLADGQVLRARHLVLATGKHPLRGFPRAGAAEGWIGARLHLRLRAAVESVVLLPVRGGYAGLQPSVGGLATLCAALAPRHARCLRDAGSFLALVRDGSPLADGLLAGAAPVQPRPVAVAGVPYGFLHRDLPGADTGLWRVGDQFAVISSFLGDGVAMGLAGGMAAAAAILAGEAAPAYHARWRRQVGGAMRIAGLAGFVQQRMPGVFAGTIAAWPAVARLVARRTRVIRG